MDRQKKEQLAVVTRCVARNSDGCWQIFEDSLFILDLIAGFRSTSVSEAESGDEEVRLSGKGIGDLLVKKMSSVRLNFRTCIGQGCDSAATMASERIGVSSIIQNDSPLAFYFHCAMHDINLSASAAINYRNPEC